MCANGTRCDGKTGPFLHALGKTAKKRRNGSAAKYQQNKEAKRSENQMHRNRTLTSKGR